jgi:hypothetical protein
MAASFRCQAPRTNTSSISTTTAATASIKDGWYACTFGPLVPWLNAQPGLADWDSAKAVWELYDLTKDFSQMHDLAKEHAGESGGNEEALPRAGGGKQSFPIGAGIWLRLHPEDRIKSPYTSWTFDETTTRMPEFTAPAWATTTTR